jgi:HEAT repeat protein
MGYQVESVGDLYNRRIQYQSAIPVLLEWLSAVENLDLKEDIVRALSVTWAKEKGARPLVGEFTQFAGRGHSVGWAIANALSVVADDRVFEDVARLAIDPRYGRDREMLAYALGNMHDTRVVDVLIEMLSDADVAGHAVHALAKRSVPKARPHLERFLQDRRTWVRNAAKRGIEKIDRLVQHPASSSAEDISQLRLLP